MGYFQFRDRISAQQRTDEEGKMRKAQVHSTETETFEKRLRAYAAGAGAVAAGLLALAPPAAAEIVVVPAHATLGYDSGFRIDIDGTTALTFIDKFRRTSSGYCVTASLVGSAPSGAGVIGYGWPQPEVRPLKLGAVIGPADQFEAGIQLLARVGSCRDLGTHVTGPFANTANRFVGMKFKLNGQVYYGWAGFSAVSTSGVSVTASLTAYAYETEPNTPIYAGQSSDNPRESRLLPANGTAPNAAKLQPATLGVLALGSIGLDVWRKQETGVQEGS
jgi:hypothetical protein